MSVSVVKIEVQALPLVGSTDSTLDRLMTGDRWCRQATVIAGSTFAMPCRGWGDAGMHRSDGLVARAGRHRADGQEESARPLGCWAVEGNRLERKVWGLYLHESFHASSGPLEACRSPPSRAATSALRRITRAHSATSSASNTLRSGAEERRVGCSAATELGPRAAPTLSYDELRRAASPRDAWSL